MTARRLTGDFGLALASDILAKLLGYVVLATLARYLTQAEMGELFFAIALVSVLASLTEVGTHRVLIRRVAQDPARSRAHLSEVLSLRVPAAALAFLVLAAIALVIMPERATVLLLTGVFVLVGDLYFTFGAFFVGLQRIGYRFTTGLIDPLILVPLILLAVHLGWELPTILGCYIVARTVSVAGTAVVIWTRLTPFGLAGSGERLRGLVRESFPFFVLGFLGLLFLKVDTLMILLFRSAEEVARYEAAYKFLEISRFAVRSASWVLFPLAAQLVIRGDMVAFRSLTFRLFGAAGVGGLAVAATVIAVGPFIVPFVWGDAYVTSVPVLQILFVSTPFLYLSFTSTFLAQALHMEKAVVWLMFVAVVANIALNALAIPRWGAEGAAWTTVVGEAALGIALCVLVLRHARKEPADPVAGEIGAGHYSERDALPRFGGGGD